MENFSNLKSVPPSVLSLGKYIFFIPEKNGIISGGTLQGIETRKGETSTLVLISAGKEIVLDEKTRISPEG